MALIKCNECEREISDKAKTCPHCGAPIIKKDTPKKTSISTWIATFIFGVIFLAIVSPSSKKTQEQNTTANIKNDQNSTQQIKKDKIENDNLDNAIHARRFLIKSLRDPDSLQIDDTMVNINGIICIKYRAKNGFGGYANGAAFYLPEKDKFRTNEMQGFSKIWKKECIEGIGKKIPF